jgi:hypothetical protein
MPSIADVMRPMWLPGLNEVCAPTPLSFKGWISAENYVISDLSPTTGQIEIFSADTAGLLSCVAHEIDRFGAATLETVAGITSKSELAQSRAWPLIRGYYAAFYAAHALSRIFGSTISKLDREETGALQRTAHASGLGSAASSINEVLYSFEIDIAGRKLVGVRRGRGPHEETWRHFERLLANLQDRILATSTGVTSEKQEVFAFLDSIRTILNHERSLGNWLSKIRNNINYRQDYGAWYPHGSGKHWTSVDGMFRAYLTDPLVWHSSVETKIIARFAKGCALVVALFMEIARDLASRNSIGKTFMSERTLAVLNKMPSP